LSKSINLDEPEEVKAELARLDWAESTKELASDILASYYNYRKIPFDKPKYERIETIPFIPIENELDSLIGGCGPKTATVLQLLKESYARIGEVWNLKWTDIDTEKGLASIVPEKGSRPRQIKLSPRLCVMLAKLPHKCPRVFGPGNLEKFRRNYEKQRNRLAMKLSNPRLLQVHFHTFRHWGACRTYWRTKDILFTQRLLGHRSLTSTLRYVQLVNWENENEFHVKAIKTAKETEDLVASGWDYVTTTPEPELAMIFRKRE